MKFNEEINNYFKEMKLKIPIFPSASHKNFRSLDQIYKFVAKEREFWDECRDGRASLIRGHFDSAISQLNQTSSYCESNIQHAKNCLSQAINTLSTARYPCIYSFTNEGKFIKTRYNHHSHQADAVIHFMFEGTVNGLNSPQYFTGLLHAFTLTNPEVAASISQTELDSLQEVRDQFHNEFNVLQREFVEENERIKGVYSDFENTILQWKDLTFDETSNFLTEKKEKLIELEKLYTEKLKLEGPATYWEKLKEEYHKKGVMWRWWAIGGTVAFTIFMTILLFKLPVDAKFNLGTVKTTIILTVMISLGLFLINFFIRLSTSAYHLSRDAAERHQLTYVYLSLLKEDAITEAERSIVLQSIFSRADTGLLKGDSSPTIPDNNMFGQLLKNINTK
ncbi:DUF6161 domain-containing protein [Fictibacillus phosphorivorans]|uniref:DUF6161 domain-containing protein n=1 Tax=Fictibacillus phosphorivorans TaxID=1221500 RepID=UPI003CF2BC1D